MTLTHMKMDRELAEISFVSPFLEHGVYNVCLTATSVGLGKYRARITSCIGATN